MLAVNYCRSEKYVQIRDKNHNRGVLGAYRVELLRAVERELRLHRSRQTEASSDRLERFAIGEFVVGRRATSNDLNGTLDELYTKHMRAASSPSPLTANE